jgi:TRAP-type C4-dicarboxylate transport system substrate-binding protein
MKKRHWMITVLAFVLILALLLPACAEKAEEPASTSEPAPTSEAAPTEVKTIKIHYSCPPNKGYSPGMEWFAEEFPKRTNGRYKVETYGASTLVPIDAVLDSTKKGVCQIGTTSLAQFSKDFPLGIVQQMPGLGWPWPGRTPESLDAQAAAQWEFLSTVPEVADEFKDFVHLGPPFALETSYLIMIDKEVRKPEDFRGTKMAATGPSAELVEANGGATVAIVVPQIFMNLEKKVVEGAMANFTMATDWKYETLCDFFYMQDFGAGLICSLMNKEFYDSMSPEDQKILVDTWNECTQVTREFQKNSTVESKGILEAAGIELKEPTAEEAAAWQKAFEEVCVRGWKEDAASVGISEATCDKVLQAWKDIRAKIWKQYNLPGEP